VKALAAIPVAVAMLLGSGAARADLLCMGTDPGFLMQIDGNETSFDYLGDGRFEVLPPVDEADILRSTRSFVLVTSQTRLPMRIEPRACPVMQTELPLQIEINVPTSHGDTVFRGCCLIRE